MTQLLSIKNRLFLIYTFTSLLAGAQQKPEKPDQLDAYEFKLKQASNTTHQILPFTSIKIVDARYDTTKVGYAAGISEYAFNKLTLKEGLQTATERFLNEYYTHNLKATDSSNLVIVIKTLWLHQINLSEKKGKKFVTKRAVDDREVTEVVARLETYIEHNNSYQALYRIDTTFITEDKIHKSGNELLLAPFNVAVDRLQTGDLNILLAKRPKLTYDAVQKYNNNRFNLPCFASNNLKEGVYITFQDFVNSKPTYTKFTTEEGKLSDELYIEQNGTKVLLTDFWGFCDGITNYINLGFNFYPFYQQGNTFEFWGSNHITHNFYRYNSGNKSVGEMLLGTGAMFNKNNTRNYLKPMQINMENGTAY